MRLKYKNILIFLSIGIILVVSMFFGLNNKKEYHELPKVKVKESIKNKQFALMLEQDNGEYKESTGEFPTEGYTFNVNKSGCTDVNGKIIDGSLDYDYETYTVLVDTSKTSYCYLYYDKEPNISYLRSKDTDDHLTKTLAGGMYRYQGIYEKDDAGNVTNDVENYICLGSDCTEFGNDLYRIIGITPIGELKVIKKTILNDIQWYNSNAINVKWPDSNVFHRLNDYEYGTYKDTSFYSTLNDNLKKFIKNHIWLYGDTNDYGVYDAEKMYVIESGKSETTIQLKNENDDGLTKIKYIWNINDDENIQAPIGLMYSYDYLYAYPNGNSGNPSSAKTAWIHYLNNTDDGSNEWIVTRVGYTTLPAYLILTIDSNGRITSNGENMIRRARPVFYLTNEIELTGEGTLSDPFRITGVD